MVKRFRVACGAAVFAVSQVSLSAQGGAVTDALDRPSIAVRDPAHAFLLAAASTDAGWIAVGERGLIARSPDGATWGQVTSPVSVTLTAIRFHGNDRGVAVGHGGTALVTNDAGRTWARVLDGRRVASLVLEDAKSTGVAARVTAAEHLVAEGPDKPLLDALWLDANRALAVGAYGIALKTEDGGKSWTSISSRLDNPKGLHLYAARQRGTQIVIAGEQGLVLRSDDGGTTFARLTTPYKGSFFTAEILPDNSIVVAGLRGNVWRSANAGATWLQESAPLPVSITASVITPAGQLVLGNQNGSLLIRSEQGLRRMGAAELPPINGLALNARGAMLALTVVGAIPLRDPETSK